MGESLESTKNSVAMPYESAPPFIIIVGAFCAMAGLQYVGNNIIYGKPKVRTHYLNSLLENEVVLLQPSRVALSVVVRHGYPPGGRDAQRVSAKRKGHPSLTPLFPPLRRSQTNTLRSTCGTWAWGKPFAAYGPGRVGQETHRARRAADRGGEAVQSKAKVRLYGRRGKEVDGSLLIRWYSKAAPQKNDRIYSCHFQYTHNANFCSAYCTRLSSPPSTRGRSSGPRASASFSGLPAGTSCPRAWCTRPPPQEGCRKPRQSPSWTSRSPRSAARRPWPCRAC